MTNTANAHEIQTNNIQSMVINQSDRKDDELIFIDPKSINRSQDGNPRDSITESDYNSLKEAIKAHNGIHTPVAVWLVDGEHELIYGNTRTDICTELNFQLIPALLKDVRSKEEALQLALSENIDRNSMTLLQEAKGLKKIVVQCSGDLEASASRMGWSESKFKKALQLLKATKKVQSLIGVKQDNDFTLTEGHASQLSLVLPKIQDRMVDLVIKDKMTISTLSSQLRSRITQPLASAIFCKKECATCEYNSNLQVPLLKSLGFDDDTCSNPICFKDKTEGAFKIKVEEMKKEHGKVVLKSTIDGSIKVTEELVGVEQLKECKRCDMYCAVLNDKSELDQGKTAEGQCINKTCLKEKMKVFMKENSLKNNENLLDKQSLNKSTDNKTSINKIETSKHKEKAINNKEVSIPFRCYNQSQKALRTLATISLKEHPNYALALTVASLQSTLGKGDVTTKMHSLIVKTTEQLLKLQIIAINTLTSEFQSTSLNMEKAVIQCARENTDSFQEKAVKAWTPNKENLGDMTKQIRIIVLEDSGFANAFKEAFSEKEYCALLSKNSDIQITEILKFNFNWTHFAPSYYIESINNPKYH